MVADVGAAPVGEPEADADDNQLHSLQSTDGPTETARTGAKNVHILPTDTRRRQHFRTRWEATPAGATTPFYGLSNQ